MCVVFESLLDEILKIFVVRKFSPFSRSLENDVCDFDRLCVVVVVVVVATQYLISLRMMMVVILLSFFDILPFSLCLKSLSLSLSLTVEISKIRTFYVYISGMMMVM